MRKYFYIGLIGLALLEILRVYLIMPMPFSQQWDSIDLAYFLHSSRWIGRLFFGVFILIGARSAFSSTKRLSITMTLLVFGVCYVFNFRMTAERMFLEPNILTFSNSNNSLLTDNSLVLVAENEGEAKAYPIRYIAYHHQVRDKLGGKEVMITYCSVCRTGRIFEPIVDGSIDKFRLVGMDHFNAMFEDSGTKSWWQQANGEAVAGPLKGYQLPELASSQMSLGKFFSLYPDGKVMKADPDFLAKYDSLGKYEFGKSKSKLTGTDSLSWKEKSWVVGIKLAGKSKAYDWNALKSQRIILDEIANNPIALVLSEDQYSFRVFLRSSTDEQISLTANDKIVVNQDTLNFNGLNENSGKIEWIPLIAYQEFWHSWRTFNPETEIYSAASSN